MTHDIPHDLEPDLARRAAQEAVKAYAERFSQYDFRSQWIDDSRVNISFAVKGKRLDGSLLVRSRDLHLTLDVPFIFRVFSGKAVQIIEREARVWLDKAKAGKLEVE